jgi:hypothetical protein
MWRRIDPPRKAAHVMAPATAHGGHLLTQPQFAGRAAPEANIVDVAPPPGCPVDAA